MRAGLPAMQAPRYSRQTEAMLSQASQLPQIAVYTQNRSLIGFFMHLALTVFSITAARARLLWQLSPYTSKLCRYVSHKNKIPVKSSAAS
ncbi:hypothetical protein DJ480_12585 [Pseudomonas sp. Leaf98]|nr:hypothetical protein DJ480_12585 [Pseudomonas sp. Leaf98]